MTKKSKLSIAILSLLLLIIAVWFGLNLAEKKARQYSVAFVAENTPWHLQLPEKVQWSINNPGAITFINAALVDKNKTVLGLDTLAINLNIKALLNNSLHVQNINADIEQFAINQQQLADWQAMDKNQAPSQEASEEPWLEKIAIDHINIHFNELSFAQNPLAITASNSRLEANDITLNLQQDILEQLALSVQLNSHKLTINDSQFEKLKLLVDAKKQNLSAQFQVDWQQHRLSTDVSASFNQGLSVNIKNLKLLIKEFNGQQLQELQQLQASLQSEDDEQAPNQKNEKPLLRNLTVEKLLVTAKSISLKEQALELSDLSIKANNMPLLQELQWFYQTREFPDFKASLTLAEGLYAKQHLKNLTVAIARKEQLIELEHLTAVLDNGEITLQGSADLSKELLPSTWQGGLNNINIQLITAESSFPSTGIVNASFSANISNSLDTENLIANTKAKVSAKSEDLQISNIDLDKLVSIIRSAREISWTDVGAIGIFGPIGLLYSTAASVGKDTIKHGQGTSHIAQVDINATSDGAWITFHDNLIATKENKISFRGQINQQSKAFKDFEIAFLNKYYCATFIQSITGTYSKPKISLSNLSAGFILNAAGDLLTLKPLREKHCKPYYQGELNTL